MERWIVKLCKFARVNASRFALTPHRDGSNLPKGGVAWEFVGEVEIVEGARNRTGLDVKEVLAAIDADGIYLSPLKSK